METIDVSKQVEFGLPDDECLPILKCTCGKEFAPWEFIISINYGDYQSCPSCGRKFYFESSIHVYEVKE